MKAEDSPYGVLFDLDGTLLDTLTDIACAMNAALADEGLPTHPVDAYRYFVGDGVDILIQRSAPESARTDAEQVARLKAGQRRHYERGWKRRTRPYPGIAEMLSDLSRRGATLAVLSNKPDDFTRRIVSEYFPETVFAQVRGARDDTPRKPDPAGARFIARTTGIMPAAWLYLGDTATDMQTARDAGMRPLGAGWGFRPAAELLAAGAERILGHPGELTALAPCRRRENEA